MKIEYINMGFLKCKSCGGRYDLQPGELPGDFDVCHCGGEIEYYLSSHEMKRRQVNVSPNELSEEE